MCLLFFLLYTISIDKSHFSLIREFYKIPFIQILFFLATMLMIISIEHIHMSECIL